MRRRLGALAIGVMSALLPSLALVGAAPAATASAAPRDPRGCPPLRVLPGSDVLSELYPSGYSWNYATQWITDFVENGYELPTLLCQSGLTTDPATGAVLPPPDGITIPVYWHVMCATATTCPVTEEQVSQQAAQMNRDYAGTHVTFSEAGIDFDVAPQYVANPALEPFSPVEFAMKRQYRKGDYSALNVYVTRFDPGFLQRTQGLLAWSTMPVPHPGLLGTTLDGVVINADFVGPGYKTMAREAGYWLSLYNPWHNGLEQPGDYIADTPPMPGPWYYCSNPPYAASLPPEEKQTLLNNIMGFTPDTCMQRFTPDQAVRMWANYLALR